MSLPSGNCSKRILVMLRRRLKVFIDGRRDAVAAAVAAAGERGDFLSVSGSSLTIAFAERENDRIISEGVG
jgi:hypothetical protein